MVLQSYTEVIDAKLRYPHTALLYIEFDSKQFNGSIPQVTCEPKMRVIRVPSNYDPENRTYSGTWTVRLNGRGLITRPDILRYRGFRSLRPRRPHQNAEYR